MARFRIVSRHKNVCKFRSHPGFSESGPGRKAAAIASKPTFVDMDPSEHTHHRSMIEQDFSEENIQSLKLKIEKNLIDEIKNKKQPRIISC
jgi:nitric oxide reductase